MDQNKCFVAEPEAEPSFVAEPENRTHWKPEWPVLAHIPVV